MFIWMLRLGRASFRWLRRAIEQPAGDNRFTCELLADISLSLHAARSPAPDQHVHLNAKLVARSDWPAETRALDAGEQQQLFLSVWKLGQQQNAARLRHGLNHQYTWHDGVVGEMSRKEWLVDGNVLDRHNTLGARDMGDTVDQQERIAMRQNPHYFFNVESKIVATVRRFHHVTHEGPVKGT